MNDEGTELKVKDIFSRNIKYVIPAYQRKYSWSSIHTTQLIEDIWDHAENHAATNYYIGILTVKRTGDAPPAYEVIDGQQRLTAIFITLCVLKKEFDAHIEFDKAIHFECRRASEEALEYIYEHGNNDEKRHTNEILHSYDDIHTAIDKMLTDRKRIDKFTTHLLDNVIAIQITVPDDTDMNHYFETMNNRGHQLEKHEVLKARMLEVIKDDNALSAAFNQIWEACSNMNQYVQHGFPMDARGRIFGCKNREDKYGWDNFNHTKIEDITDATKNTNKGESDNALSIDDIIKQKQHAISIQGKSDDTRDRLTSPINFTNFLLHVLRIQSPEDQVPLDDKRLLIAFDKHLEHNGPLKTGGSDNEAGNKNFEPDCDAARDFVKKFIFNLLRLRFLFDKYVIKSGHHQEDRWTLKKLMRTSNRNTSYSGYYSNTFDKEDNGADNRKPTMLLAMFHVSFPSATYKHWLSAVLKYLHEHKTIKASEYIAFMEELATTFIYDRFLAKTPIDYHEIIFTHNCKRKNGLNDIDKSLLDKGTKVENFIFNYLDYLLWKLWKEKKEYREHIFATNDNYDEFTFSSRDSVEHYYPVNPDGDIPRLPSDVLNHFGNLCLIMRGQNSRLGNRPPKIKKTYYVDNKIKDSIKQGVMMNFEEWTEKEIKKHGEQMKELLVFGELSMADRSMSGQRS